MPAVLFVCSANQCRSPMAEALFKELLSRRGFDLEDWQVESAGVWTYDGSQATALAREVMLERGLDIHNHRSKSVSGDRLLSYDLILVMEARHQDELQRLYPEVADRVRMMSSLTDQHADVDDPVYGTIETYRETVNYLQELLERGLSRILQWVDQPG